MDPVELFKYGAQLGVGGLLAALMFLVAWRYVTRQVEEGKQDKKILIDLVADIMVVITKSTEAVSNNTLAANNNTAVINELRRELSQRG